ncbi:hypothetical protein AK812_SmicGene17545 [Symbiodinium microadriaticum]|uniref:Uncharacterized protein n=1 Tax=Symbiodinium microadriaticum TaxID=2951 RepID=A0A1Q9DXF5_SYMMI|nr:hypothetical protein AK812_SmicGene17545 [Symbiodinium microadriaticum]
MEEAHACDSATDVITRLTDEKALIEEQLQQEKLQREELCRQLQALEAKQRAAERAFEEKKEIEEKLRLALKANPYLLVSLTITAADAERQPSSLPALQPSSPPALQPSSPPWLDGCKETLLAKESAADLQKRLSVLEQQVSMALMMSTATTDREADLVSQLDALKGIQESFALASARGSPREGMKKALDEEQLAAKREEQHRQREVVAAFPADRPLVLLRRCPIDLRRFTRHNVQWVGGRDASFDTFRLQ